MNEKSRPPAAGLGYQAAQVEHLGALVEGSSGGVLLARLAAYARPVDENSPYCVANDYVATALGMAMGVPVPPGTLMKLGPDWGFVSVGFGEHGRRPPPADLEALGAERPWETTGVIVLDQWVSNRDRHDGNVAYLPSLGVAAFDHDQALFGACPPNEGLASLEQSREVRVKHHPFGPYLQTAEHFESWIARTQSVTREELRRAVWACVDSSLLDRQDAEALLDFLQHRQRNIGTFVRESYSEFSGISTWTLDANGGE